MSQKTEITPQDLRRRLKALGLKLRTRAYSQFSEGRVYDGDQQINGGNVLDAAHLEKYAGFYELKNSVSVIEDGWRTII